MSVWVYIYQQQKLQPVPVKCSYKVPFRVLPHFTRKASVTSVNAETNVHSADWLMSVFVNELTLPYVRSQQGQCMQQCRRIMKDTVWKFSRVI